ncbi:MAG: SPOR domain-containing protein [Proteobacteria bacterium]|nr:SPOR domain-containing protein [Pseudomonadota bacterium]
MEGWRLSVRFVVSRRSRAIAIVLIAAIALLVASADNAEARRNNRSARKSAYNPPSASIVVDANSRKTLHAANADSLRHPASLTKVMTLYLLFEQLESGRLRLTSAMPVSAHAAAQAPTKLGLKPGQSIDVEDAIKGLVTKSANDAAVVVAEAIAGDEEEFARLMTRKARALGMTRTVYRNASGLPDDEQVTTAREQALLGGAIRERFPRYYKFFATHSFHYRGMAMRNHNRLLGRVEGVDGIKTGYTRASGFNLVASVNRGNRHIVAVVLGGRSASARDARMRQIIAANIDDASTKRTAPAIADTSAAKRGATRVASTENIVAPSSTETVKSEPVETGAISAPPLPQAAPRRAKIAPAPAPKVAAREQAPAPGSSEPLRPVAIKTILVRPGAIRSATHAPLAGPLPAHGAPAGAADAAAEKIAAAPGALEANGTHVSAAPDPAEAIHSGRAATPAPKPVTQAASGPAAPRDAAARGGWAIQIGAFDAETEARERLGAARQKAKSALGRADPYTERVVKGDKTLFRARFAGFDKDAAQQACKILKQKEFACLALKI